VNELPFHRERPDAKVATPLSYWDLRTFDDVLDARSPAEYAEDHLPEAINTPVLDDAERALVGTIYKQKSAFDAKRAGAPLVARNIARYIDERFRDKPRNWKPLVYCWRGGGRSNSLVHVLRQVGWDAQRLDGGYKAFRKQVVGDLEKLPARIQVPRDLRRDRVRQEPPAGGARASGAQVLDLEVLARTAARCWASCPTRRSRRRRLRDASSGRRSRASIRRAGVRRSREQEGAATCACPRRSSSACAARAASGWRPTCDARGAAAGGLRALRRRPAALAASSSCCATCTAPSASRMEGAPAERRWDALVRDLLESHYDPAYRRSLLRNYRDAQTATPLTVGDISRAGFLSLARRSSGAPLKDPAAAAIG
jgi:tRNA 2-selenouridine synthase